MPLSTVIGHASIITLLRQAVARGRVPHSLLFAGPEGVGKRAVALALAQAVNCPERLRAKSDDACGRCSACTRILRGQFADVTLIERGDEASIKLDTLREQVLGAVGYRPFEGQRRVFILEADDIKTGQDALLKTLEEPPPSAILILLSSFPDALLATVQSRCRRLRFGPLTERDVQRVLVERLGIDRKAAAALAAASGGSVSRALDEQGGHLAEDRDAALAVLAAAGRPVGDQLKASANLAKHGSSRRDREALGARLDILASLVRDLGALVSGTRAPLANGDLETDLRALSARFTLSRLAASYDSLVRARTAIAIGRNASPKLVADWIALEL